MFHSLFDWLEYYNNIFNSLFLRIFFILWRVYSERMLTASGLVILMSNKAKIF
ncbi:hypothetical protein HMPREF1432_01221 [Helicobacter pylori GAMchJs114i]|nr:hypothetical protein HMPREF1432_01221 [Helicobacter pylori GAMchJs114i]